MMRRPPFRSLLAMLLAYCLVSASLWSFGTEALADVLSDEVALTATGTPAAHHGPAGEACNHGCHALSHLTGADCTLVSLPAPEPVQFFQVYDLARIPSHPRDGPFRPPRTAFQA